MNNRSKQELLNILDESIRLENNAAKIYALFAGQFPEDKDFWQKLSNEEVNHAQLIEREVKFFLEELFPENIFCKNMKRIQKANDFIVNSMKEFSISAPTRKQAFDTAIKIEESAGESHFQNGITQSNKSLTIRLFQELNQNDKDHAIRIRKYMKKNKIT